MLYQLSYAPVCSDPPYSSPATGLLWLAEKPLLKACGA
jgi:hypothetical protein